MKKSGPIQNATRFVKEILHIGIVNDDFRYFFPKYLLYVYVTDQKDIPVGFIKEWRQMREKYGMLLSEMEDIVQEYKNKTRYDDVFRIWTNAWDRIELEKLSKNHYLFTSEEGTRLHEQIETIMRRNDDENKLNIALTEYVTKGNIPKGLVSVTITVLIKGIIAMSELKKMNDEDKSMLLARAFAHMYYIRRHRWDNQVRKYQLMEQRLHSARSHNAPMRGG